MLHFNGMQDPLIMELDSGQYPKVATFFEKLLGQQMFVCKGVQTSTP